MNYSPPVKSGSYVFLYSPQAKHSSEMLKWLEKMKRIMFRSYKLYEIQISAFMKKFIGTQFHSLVYTSSMAAFMLQ